MALTGVPLYAGMLAALVASSGKVAARLVENGSESGSICLYCWHPRRRFHEAA